MSACRFVDLHLSELLLSFLLIFTFQLCHNINGAFIAYQIRYADDDDDANLPKFYHPHPYQDELDNFEVSVRVCWYINDKDTCTSLVPNTLMRSSSEKNNAGR